jgi:para-aminobenzoate synthetase component 1
MVFLDSAATHPSWGRYSIIGFEPRGLLSADSEGKTYWQHKSEAAIKLADNPLDALEKLLAGFQLDPTGCPTPCFCGMIGYLAYDIGRFIERLPARAVDDLNMPVLNLGFYDRVAVYDHVDKRWIIQALLFPGHNNRDGKLAKFKQLLELANTDSRKESASGKITLTDIRSNFEQEQYERVVQRAKDYIAAGDIFQVNLSQRFEAKQTMPAPEIYRRLRGTNPGFFAAYLDGGDWQVLSSSPELFLFCNKKHVITRPIKGTRPRGDNSEQDELLKNELLASEKDAAELNMIIDLERNDLGRTCEFGSVRVCDHRALETHPTVHHLVATVKGSLRKECGIVDLLRATMPGGSITGAPKIRAMEIVEELEPHRRGVYTGAIGHIGLDGSCRLNVAIRTMTVKGRKIYWNVGGGIVADSVPLDEYHETLHKGRGMLAALTGE